MTEVVFSGYKFRFEIRDSVQYIFDEVRRKFVPNTPEEYVRQHVIQYLLQDKKYPRSLIAVERSFDFNGLKKRFDILVFNQLSKPVMIIECKAHSELLNEKVFRQIAIYNAQLKVDYLWVTNGHLHYCCHLSGSLEWLNKIPEFNSLQ